MDGFTDLLDYITDDCGLFFLSVCNKAVVPRWLYASYWWRHWVVLRTRISTLALQLPFPKISESMGNHDSKIVDAGSVD